MLRSTHTTRTESSTEPVTVDEIRKQLRIDHGEDDRDIADMISEARAYCETVKLNDVSLIDATCVDYLDGFGDDIELRWSPVDSITSITYVDTAGATQTLATSVYELGTRNGLGVVRLKYSQNWPSTRGHEDVVTITYTAGYGTAASDVPLGIRRWIKARASWLYENRDGVEFPFRLDMLLAPYQRAGIVGPD